MGLSNRRNKKAVCATLNANFLLWLLSSYSHFLSDTGRFLHSVDCNFSLSYRLIAYAAPALRDTMAWVSLNVLYWERRIVLFVCQDYVERVSQVVFPVVAGVAEFPFRHLV